MLPLSPPFVELVVIVLYIWSNRMIEPQPCGNVIVTCSMLEVYIFLYSGCCCRDDGMVIIIIIITMKMKGCRRCVMKCVDVVIMVMVMVRKFKYIILFLYIYYIR